MTADEIARIRAENQQLRSTIDTLAHTPPEAFTAAHIARIRAEALEEAAKLAEQLGEEWWNMQGELTASHLQRPRKAHPRPHPHGAVMSRHDEERAYTRLGERFGRDRALREAIQIVERRKKRADRFDPVSEERVCEDILDDLRALISKEPPPPC